MTTVEGVVLDNLEGIGQNDVVKLTAIIECGATDALHAAGYFDRIDADTFVECIVCDTDGIASNDNISDQLLGKSYRPVVGINDTGGIIFR